MECMLLVPGNAVTVSGRVLLLDAYFWNSVDDFYKPLLVFPEQTVPDEGVRLDPRVNVERQLDDLRRLSEGLRTSTYPGIRDWLRKAVALVLPVPGGLFTGLARKHAKAMEMEIAERIARYVVGGRPLGRVSYVPLTLKYGASGRVEVEAPGIVGRVYSRLMGECKGFRREVYALASSFCR